ncbi:MAG: pentapeptide repeat-containing protein [Hyphomicrobium sp.]|nr:pentapeptide repeat-containing protein [Hyphomicrobium sp.]
MVDHLDLKSDEFTKADVTRDDVLAAIAAAGADGTADFSGRRLNGLDLSGLDLRRLKLQSARINGANFAGANLEGVVLDQAWALKSDFTKANLKGASLFSTQLMDAKMPGADFAGARIAADFSRADLKGANFCRCRPVGRHEEPVDGADARRVPLEQARGRILQRRQPCPRSHGVRVAARRRLERRQPDGQRAGGCRPDRG